MGNGLSVITDPIQHVVMLILENHSFDQMLGGCAELSPGLDGVSAMSPRSNADDAGKVYNQAPTLERQMLLDPQHDVEHVATQLENGNSGFVKDFARSFPGAGDTEKRFVMGYYPLGSLPALHALARGFTICDRWFASVPGPTWPNRFFALTGTSSGRVGMPEDGKHGIDLPGWFEQGQPTIFDRLNEKAIHWKVYFHDIPQTCVLPRQRSPVNAARYFPIDAFFRDARGLEADFPSFCLIEPDYMGSGENDDHPPHDIMKAQKLIADVYNALRANEPLWKSTLFVLFYDEHGGFYDHVPPPSAVPPDDQTQEYLFDRLGPRVPALLISPWVRAQVCHAQFDHTSVLRYLIEKWELGPLGHRAAAANTIGEALDLHAGPRTDTIARIELSSSQLSPPDPALEEKAEATLTSHHLSLATMLQYLKVEAVEELPRAYTAFARGIERVKSACEWVLRWLYGERRHLKPRAAEANPVADRHAALAGAVDRFLRSKRGQAIPILARTIRDASATDAERRHAVRTLGTMTGRRFHHDCEPAKKADAWLCRHGH